MKFQKLELEHMPFLEAALLGHYRRLVDQWNKKVEIYLRDNLLGEGYAFTSDNEFYTFCKERISRLAFTDKPNYYEFYLDYVTPEKRGIFIGSCSDKVTIDIGKNTTFITYTIG